MAYQSSVWCAEHRKSLTTGGTAWPPYLYITDNNEPAGEDYQLLKSVLGKLDYALESQILPERRVTQQIELGQIDVVTGAAFTPARALKNYFSVPYRKETISFAFHPSHHNEYAGKSLETLLREGKTLALNTGGWFGDWFNETVTEQYSAQLIHLDSVKRRLQFLNRGRVDLVLDDIRVISFNAEQLQLELEISNKPVNVQDVHFMFSKQSVDPGFIDKFNHVLSDYVKDPDPAI